MFHVVLHVIVAPDGAMVKPPTVFRGKNAIDQFLTKLLDEEKSILDTLRFVKPMVFSMTDEENFKSSTLCSICENPLNGDAVRDHDHLTGAYRGAAHNRCNLNFKLANYIPVVIHNLRNYDGHFLIQGTDDSEIGYKFEDLEYPDELHDDLNNCYPLAPEKIEVSLNVPPILKILLKNSVF
ncbi:uncharacterized protein TNCV_3447141 [Trichonephila clavipes]|nr:uncharacterized protein TNCV_3447141 [Trichonephila clavipes]